MANEVQRPVGNGTEHRAEGRSLGELFSDLTQETATLVRQEVNLAKTELTQKVTVVGANAASLAIGGVLAFAGLLGIMAAIIAGIVVAGLPLWASALLVGGVFALIGGALVLKGLQGIRNVDPVPHQTLDSLKEDEEWLKRQTK